MPQSRRSSRTALKAIGDSSDVNLSSALPVGVGQLPHAHRLSKPAKRRLTWLDYRKTHTVAQTCRYFDRPRSTLNRWAKRFDPRDPRTIEDRPSRPRHMGQRTGGVRAVDAVLALRTEYPRWERAELAVLLACQRLPLSASMIGRIPRYLRQRRSLVEPRSIRATPRARHARPHAQRRPKGEPLPKGLPGDLVQIDTMRLPPLPSVVRYTSRRSISSRATALRGRDGRQRGPEGDGDARIPGHGKAADGWRPVPRPHRHPGGFVAHPARG